MSYDKDLEEATQALRKSAAEQELKKNETTFKCYYCKSEQTVKNIDLRWNKKGREINCPACGKLIILMRFIKQTF